MRIYLPEDLYTKVYLLHYSEAQGRVPYSAISDWFERLVKEEFERIKHAQATQSQPTQGEAA